MTAEFIGFIENHRASEAIPQSGPVIDRNHIRALATAHEHGGFDRVLLAFHSDSPDSLFVGQYVAGVTTRLGPLLAHRPGFTAPSKVARQLATLDHLTNGRVAVHIITGGNDRELAQDGGFLTRDERYARSDEFLDILRRQWTSDESFDHDGCFYRLHGAFSHARPLDPGSIPVFFGGSSAPAIAVAGKHADVYALWGETYPQTAETIARVRPAPAQGARLDKRVWTEIAALTGAAGNSTSLVGTPDQVAEAMLDYYRVGVTTFLIRGFDSLPDAVEYGQELLPRARALVAAEGEAATGQGRLAGLQIAN